MRRAAWVRGTPLPLVALAITGALALVWLILDPRTADLAAQAHREALFDRAGFAVWDNGWFAGHHIPGYSLFVPALSGVVGLHALGVIAALGSSALFALLARDEAVGADARRRRLAVAWFALVVGGDLFIGRITFAVGVTCAVGCVLALSRRRHIAALLLGVLTATATPVGGLLLALVLVAGVHRLPARWRIPLVAAPLVVAVLETRLFPEGGTQPYPWESALVAVAVAVAVGLLVDPRRTAIRRGAALYALAIVAVLVVPSPMGTNVARLGVLAAGPVLVLGLRRGAPRALVVGTVLAIVAWQLWAPVSEGIKAAASPATSEAYFDPLLRRLGTLGPARIEVVPTSTRWESVYVPPRMALARGWETQLDRRYDRLFYEDQLDPAEYRRWLDGLAVSYVAVSDAPKERWGRTEERLLRRPPAYLHEVWRSAHWRLFAVRRPRPIVPGGRLVALAPQSFTIDVPTAGSRLVRVRYTPLWRGSGGSCTSRGAGGFTTVRVPRPGRYTVRAGWSPWRILAEARDCDGAVERAGEGPPRSTAP